MQQLGGHVLRAHLEAPPHHSGGTELRQTGHGAQTVSESPGLAGREETVGTHLQTVQSEMIMDQNSKAWHSSWLPQSREGSGQDGQVVVVGLEVFQAGQFPQRRRQTLDVVLADVQTDKLEQIAEKVREEDYLVPT